MDLTVLTYDNTIIVIRIRTDLASTTFIMRDFDSPNSETKELRSRAVNEMR